MKRIASISSTFLLLGIFFLAAPANAHVLKSDGTIGVFLHFDPVDDLVVGLPADYILAFSDTTNRFKVADCDCRLTIKEDNRIIQTKSIKDTYPYYTKGSYVFPRVGVYTLLVSGKPKSPDAFQPFALTFSVRVGAGKTSSQPSKQIPVALKLGLALTTLLLLVGSYKWVSSISQKNSKNS